MSAIEPKKQAIMDNEGGLGDVTPLSDRPPTYSPANPPSYLAGSAQSPNSGLRTIHVYRDSLTNPDHHYTIKDDDDDTVIYIADISAMTRPQIQIYSSAEYNVKGSRTPLITAKLHHTDTDVEINLRGQKFFYVANGWIHQKYEWPSPAFGMDVLRWKRDLSSGSKECVASGDKKTVLARWIGAGWAPSKVGELQILTDVVSTDAGSAALEELLVTVLADREIDNKLSSA